MSSYKQQPHIKRAINYNTNPVTYNWNETGLHKKPNEINDLGA
ncbi:hypothetical protein [Pseudomonas amygdali]|nr:hypothetical protein [Pseudomonas amygdali]